MPPQSVGGYSLKEDSSVVSVPSIPDSLLAVPEPLQDSVELEVYRLLKDTFSIIGVGDIMLGTNFPDKGYLPPNEGKHLLSPVIDILQDADVTFGNLEGVLLDSGGTQKNCSNPDVCYLFRSPVKYVNHLLNAGFDVVSLANNHAGDFGDEGRRSTMKTLDKAGIEHAGQLTKPYVTFNKNGLRFGMVAFSPNYGTVSINDLPNAVNIVKHLDSISDIVIVSFHGGAEGSKFQHVTRKTEIFYGENRGNVYEFAHALIDAGADVVFGHGPHVTRAIEVYRNRFIAYSLGNFATYARFNLKGENGIAPIIKVFTDARGKMLYARIFPVLQAGEGGPVPDPGIRAIKVLQKLTHEDFPEVPVQIDDSGLITYIEQINSENKVPDLTELNGN